MRLPTGLIRPFTILVERFYPDALVFAVFITALTAGLALALTHSGPIDILLAWGDGLPKLLSFMAQISLTLLGATVLANTDLVHRLLAKFSDLPKSDIAAYAMVALIASIGSLFAWSLGLVVGAIMAKEVALACQRKKLKIHYPLLVASAYSGFVVWHMGYSSSAALFVATPGHALEPIMGIVPVTETILTLSNALIALVAVAGITLICPMMRPGPEEKIIEVDPARLTSARPASRSETETIDDENSQSFAERMEGARILSVSLGMALLAYIATSMIRNGFYLDLNVVNWSFLGLALVLVRSPRHFIESITDASRMVGPLLIQYPFYAGIMGIMAGTGLVAVLSDWFTAVSSAETLGLTAFLSAGLVNLFIPSGGGQWAVQGPVFIEAANQLGVKHSVIVMAIAYGDQWTNMIQPLFTIPLLAIAGLGLRQIMGYTVVIFLLTAVIFGGGLLIIGAG